MRDFQFLLPLSMPSFKGMEFRVQGRCINGIISEFYESFSKMGIIYVLTWCYVEKCRYLGLPHPGLVLYKNCIELEMNLACAGNNDGLINARNLYESALTTYDRDVSLWRDYYLMEVKVTLFLPVLLTSLSQCLSTFSFGYSCFLGGTRGYLICS